MRDTPAEELDRLVDQMARVQLKYEHAGGARPGEAKGAPKLRLVREEDDAAA